MGLKKAEYLLSRAWYKRSKSSLDLGFILLSNSFFILSAFSFFFLISSSLSHSNRLTLSSLSLFT